MKGVHPNQHAEVDEGWIAVRANKTLTNQRFRYNKMIDKQERKPSHISDKHWNKMVKIRMTQAAQEKSKRMRGVALGKGGKAAVMATLREGAVVKLVRSKSAFLVAVLEQECPCVVVFFFFTSTTYVHV